MISFVRRNLAWAIYYLGHLVSKVMLAANWSVFITYPVYSWLMRVSGHIQGETDDGPWEWTFDEEFVEQKEQEDGV